MLVNQLVKLVPWVQKCHNKSKNMYVCSLDKYLSKFLMMSKHQTSLARKIAVLIKKVSVYF